MVIQRHTLRLFRALALVVLVVLVAGFTVWPSSSLLRGSNLPTRTDLRTYWNAGNIVMLVRHAERCDRSTNACMRPADGITQVGRIEAAQVGASFAELGMASTDVFSSPLTRTVQTAHAIFQGTIENQAWLENCHADITQVILAHKVVGRNLVLVTHSACISQFEARLSHAYAPTADYTSSLVVQVKADGTLGLLGVIKPQDWRQVIQNLDRPKSDSLLHY